jgi:hypothetical protein
LRLSRIEVFTHAFDVVGKRDSNRTIGLPLETALRVVHQESDDEDEQRMEQQ